MLTHANYATRTLERSSALIFSRVLEFMTEFKGNTKNLQIDDLFFQRKKTIILR